MYRRMTVTLATMALLSLAIALPAGNAVAQQRQQVSFKVSSENSKYTQQLNVDVGDVPNHMVRIFDLHPRSCFRRVRPCPQLRHDALQVSGTDGLE